ncbi:glycosyltransferase involved in cell wall biosynthesis [Lewinella aquimaris]|uniref:Glycosyltransferase involved in cell wall biosynthesis n=1 Tax=Neolewinella aquimaris TaxID=1835722 RepID=A0A840E6J8_9BACT|nr:glycosyltransferase [Neolewinella aquimaris]MBB4079352.1 glycosyltransferase involved in cell wall biosynthesis [Neolewinella aquimaris]
MISICIPVFNHDARPLVEELVRQAGALNVPVEILLYDDGSDERCKLVNREVATHPGVRYLEQPTTMGRAIIRNKMAREASHDLLVMLNADSRPNPLLLQRYLADPDVPVIVGGTTYSETRPDDPALWLHWHYGRARKALAPARRRPKPYLHFQSNNFRVSREFFLQHPFPKVDGCGHEDTLWGQLLAPTSTNIEYIDNPVENLVLERAEDFMRKQREAIESLKQLRQQHPTLATRLTTFADRYPKMTQLTEILPERALTKYLMRTNNLHALDALKLKWWITGWGLAISYP